MADHDRFFYAIVAATVLSMVWAWLRRRRRQRISRRIAASQPEGHPGRQVQPAASSVPPVGARGGRHDVTPAPLARRLARAGSGAILLGGPDGMPPASPWHGMRGLHGGLYGGHPQEHSGAGFPALPPRAAAGRRSRRARVTRAEARRGIVLLTILGPCRALEPHGGDG